MSSVCCGGYMQLTTLASQALHDKTLCRQKLRIAYVDAEQYYKLIKGMRQTSVGLARQMYSMTALKFWLIWLILAHRKTAELPTGEAIPLLQPLPRPPMRHNQRLAVPASAYPPTLIVADIEGVQVGLHHHHDCACPPALD